MGACARAAEATAVDILQCSRLQKTSRIRVWEEVKKLQRLGSLRCAAFRRMLRRNRLDPLPRDALPRWNCLSRENASVAEQLRRRSA
jgi:hypothetical protein